jgi:hypothetical protein
MSPNPLSLFRTILPENTFRCDCHSCGNYYANNRIHAANMNSRFQLHGLEPHRPISRVPDKASRAALRAFVREAKAGTGRHVVFADEVDMRVLYDARYFPEHNDKWRLPRRELGTDAFAQLTRVMANVDERGFEKKMGKFSMDLVKCKELWKGHWAVGAEPLKGSLFNGLEEALRRGRDCFERLKSEVKTELVLRIC